MTGDKNLEGKGKRKKGATKDERKEVICEEKRRK